MDFSRPEFWSVVVALLALVLSQLPPLSELLKGTKVKLFIPELFALGHYMGSMHISLFVDVHNVGGRAVNIAKIECVIREVEAVAGRSWRVPARTYYSRLPPSPNQPSVEFFIGNISLKSGEHWSETIHCYNFWSRAEEERVNEISSKIRSNIAEKLRKSQQPQMPVEADESLVKEANDFFEEKYKTYNISEEGNYQILIAIHSDTGEILQIRGFEFTLFKSNIQSLKAAAAEDYKYGAGITHATTNPAATIWARIRPISDERNAKQIFQKI